MYSVFLVGSDAKLRVSVTESGLAMQSCQVSAARSAPVLDYRGGSCPGDPANVSLYHMLGSSHKGGGMQAELARFRMEGETLESENSELRSQFCVAETSKSVTNKARPIAGQGLLRRT